MARLRVRVLAGFNFELAASDPSPEAAHTNAVDEARQRLAHHVLSLQYMYINRCGNTRARRASRGAGATRVVVHLVAGARGRAMHREYIIRVR